MIFTFDYFTINFYKKSSLYKNINNNLINMTKEYRILNFLLKNCKFDFLIFSFYIYILHIYIYYVYI